MGRRSEIARQERWLVVANRHTFISNEPKAVPPPPPVSTELVLLFAFESPVERKGEREGERESVCASV